MSDTSAPQGANDRRRRNHRRRSGNPNNRGGNRSGNFRPAKAPQQTTLQKILSILTFGLIGGAKKKPSAPRREPTSNVTVVSSKRGESSDRPRRQPSPADPGSVTSAHLLHPAHSFGDVQMRFATVDGRIVELTKAVSERYRVTDWMTVRMNRVERVRCSES